MAEEIFFCAGMPYIGDRAITESERTDLGRDLGNSLIKFMLLIIATLGLLISFAFLIWYSEEIDVLLPQLNGLIPVFLIIPFIFGISLAIVRACDSFERSRTLWDSLSGGNFACFEGNLNNDDWTDENLKLLLKTKLTSTDCEHPNKIEIFKDRNILYKINGVRPRKWIKLRLTSAALPEHSTPHFSLPAAWLNGKTTLASPQSLERRRLSSEEINEIRSYAKEIRKRAIYLFFLSFAGISFVMSIIMTTVGFTFEEVLQRSIAGAFLFGFFLALRQERRARGVYKDAKVGWAIIRLPVDAAMKENKDATETSLIEFLPVSRIVWRVSEKPASWRGKN